MQVMPMQPLLLHSHPLQLCRLSMHGLELMSSRLGNMALQLSLICSSYGRDKKDQTEGDGLRKDSRGRLWVEITNQTVGGAASHDHEEDR